VGFLWDEASSTFLIYSRADAKRLIHLQQNSAVALNFDSNGIWGNIVVITGHATVSTDDPPADQLPAWVEKYGELIARRYATPEHFASIYSVALRIRPIAIRGL
jgi:PPOX class probable F420-dependent enzyme